MLGKIKPRKGKTDPLKKGKLTFLKMMERKKKGMIRRLVSENSPITSKQE